MKRRRQGIRVDTFPFLAVLLCAMGSLILLLLVIDRRAKVAARAKALEEARQVYAQRARLATVDKEAWEKKCRELHDLLTKQDLELKAQLAKILGEKAATTRRLQDEQTDVQNLKQAVAKQRADLDQQRYYISQRRGTLARASEKEKASQQELIRLAQDLDQLDRTLQTMLALKRREQQTYSLIPYRGKRGDNRKPVYVECSFQGLIFHPGQRLVMLPALNPEVMRAEVERITGALPEDPKASAKGAYLLFLVRPEGITTYYAAQEVLKGLPVDYGYEFVDADMAFDFSGGQNVEPMMPQAPPPAFTTGLGGPLPLGAPVSMGVRPGSGQGTYVQGSASAVGQGNYGGSGDARGRARPEASSTGWGLGVDGVGAGQPGQGPGGFGSASGPGGAFPGPGGDGSSGSGSGLAGDVSGRTGPARSGQGFLENGLAGPGPVTPGASLLGPLGGGSGTGPYATRPWGPQPTSPLPYGPGFDGSRSLLPRQGTGDPGGTWPGGGASGSPQAQAPPGMTGTGSGRLGQPGIGQIPGVPGGLGPSNGQGTGPAGVGIGSGSGLSGNGNARPALLWNSDNTETGPNRGTGGAGGSAGVGGPGSSAGPFVTMAPPSATPPGANADNVPWKASTHPSTGFAGNPSMAGGQNAVPGPSQQTMAARGYPSGQAAAPSGGATGNPGLEDPDKEGQRPHVQLYGGGGDSGSSGSPPPLPTMATPLSALEKADKRRPTVTPALARRFGNRDFTIVLECTADAVLVQPWGTRFPVAALPDKASADVALVRAVQQRIAQRQASVQPGEPPYRALIRFKVHPEGLRAYYQAYPLLVPLGIPMMRESLDDSRN